ncbi:MULTISPECIES: hypothetical protein [unclassified Xanthobacter]|uniref:hypothetical protein n=1 Tax=unclassified Xanthobacter TaxID=2623496 RepID=UPI001F20AA4B|nr:MULTISPECIES: hypothetical protein [unclassified Xanthobacter]
MSEMDEAEVPYEHLHGRAGGFSKGGFHLARDGHLTLSVGWEGAKPAFRIERLILDPIGPTLFLVGSDWAGPVGLEAVNVPCEVHHYAKGRTATIKETVGGVTTSYQVSFGKVAGSLDEC